MALGGAVVVLLGCHPAVPPRSAPAPRTQVMSLERRVPAPPFPVLVREREAVPAGWLLVPSLRVPPSTAAVPGPAGAAGWPEVSLGPDECRSRCVLDVSIADRVVSLVVGRDTLFQAPAAVASGVTLVHDGRSWTFRTPRGERRVLRKVVNPVWTPPEWHYAEAARDHGLKLAILPPNGTTVSGGRRLEIRNGVVGIVRPGKPFRALPVDEHIVFDGRLYIPPVGTRNRRLRGDLGQYALDLGDGYMIHGTPYQASIGQATTHGCVRLRDRDIAWLFEHVPVGARVQIR